MHRYLIGFDSWSHPFSNANSGSSPPGLWLKSRGRHDTVIERDRRDGKWTRDRISERGRTFTAEYVGPRLVETNESYDVTYFVWDDFESDGYLNPGGYRFEGWISIHDDQVGDAVDVLDWGFSLELTRTNAAPPA